MNMNVARGLVYVSTFPFLERRSFTGLPILHPVFLVISVAPLRRLVENPVSSSCSALPTSSSVVTRPLACYRCCSSHSLVHLPSPCSSRFDYGLRRASRFTTRPLTFPRPVTSRSPRIASLTRCPLVGSHMKMDRRTIRPWRRCHSPVRSVSIFIST
jgi:hypothetical protein